jgi:hypothetical protein
MRLGALVTGACLALAPDAIHAQRGPVRDATIEFGRANDTGDGHVNARVTVRYQFADCEGDVRVLYAMDRASIAVSGGYYYRGTWYQVPGSIAPPRLETVAFSGPILNPAGIVEGTFSDPYTQGSAGSGCIGQSKTVFTRKGKLGDGVSAERYLSFLQGLSIQPRTLSRLRDDAVEQWIRGELAKLRDDSLSRLARDREHADSLKRRQAREQARRDSVERAREAADANGRDEAAKTNAARDSATRAEESEDAREQAEQAAKDKKDALDRKASGDAQTERLNRMFAIEKGEWEQAEAAYARGDLATARPLYEKLAGSLVYGGEAKARLKALNEQQMADGVMGVFNVLGYFNRKLDGTGLFFGPSYGPTGFPGDKGNAGLTIGFASSPQQRWIPYVDLLMGLGADDADAVRYMPNESFGGLAAGTTTPWLKLPLGRNATLAPHLGFRSIVTDLRTVNVGQAGLMLVTRGMLLRADAVIINGKPQYNGALARVF